MGRIRAERRLKARDIGFLPPGLHEDGGGLRLLVEPTGSRRWVLRVTIAGKRRYRGLGSYPLVGLALARDQAADIRRAARQGRDLAQERRQELARLTTFKEAFATFFELRRQELGNAKHIWQWSAAMESYIFPTLGHRYVAEITHAEIISVLRPIWFEKAETARRLLQRMELVFKSAILRGQRLAASPCGGVAQELGVRHREVTHYRALPYAEVPAFIQTLRAWRAMPVTKLAFEWLILTATRSGEARGAAWTEIDGEVWRIPATRMKAGVMHLVPLSSRCREILVEARALNPRSELLFPGGSASKLSDMTFTKVLRDMGLADRATAHGFRSAFKDWCAEAAKVADEISEAALAHTVSGRVRAAYLRTRFAQERVQLMACWAAFCGRDQRE
jgi:integrase